MSRHYKKILQEPSLTTFPCPMSSIGLVNIVQYLKSNAYKIMLALT